MLRPLSRSLPLCALLLAALLALSACAPRASRGGAELRAPALVILGGAVCRPGGVDALPEVVYLCERPATGADGEAALVAPLELQGTDIVYRRASLQRAGAGEGGPTLGPVATVRTEVAEATLASGERCFFAGRGATLTVDGLRLSYTCEDPDTVLLGGFERRGDAVLIQRATLERAAGVFEVSSPETVGVTRLAVAP